MVEGTVGIFGFWISTARTNSTVALCDVEGTKLFLNVDFVAGFRSVDDKLPQLGGRTVRETLRLLERPRAEEGARDAEGPTERPTEAPLKPVECDDGSVRKRKRMPDFEKLIDLIQQQSQCEVQRILPVLSCRSNIRNFENEKNHRTMSSGSTSQPGCDETARATAA